MNTETLFTIFNTGVLLPWLLLLVAPKWGFTQKMLETKWPILILAVAYLSLLLIDLFTATNSSIDFMSLTSIKAAFGRDEVMLIGWIHYLAFDLFVGMWELKDGQQRGVAHYWLVPCLILTLMYGPVGFLLYTIVKQFYPHQEIIAPV